MATTTQDRSIENDVTRTTAITSGELDRVFDEVFGEVKLSATAMGGVDHMQLGQPRTGVLLADQINVAVAV